jgi:acyl-coenzyme A synthetase/AMP-(fatty) acid ligase
MQPLQTAFGTTPGSGFNFAADVAYRRARETPGATAVLFIDRQGCVESWTFERVALEAQRLAAGLARAGLKKGDRVLIMMARVPRWQVAMTACLHLGLVPVPCVTQASPAEMAYRAQKCGARGAIADSAFAERFAGLDLPAKVSRGTVAGWLDFDALVGATVDAPPAAPMSGEDPALMYFTSGSSGPPKAVLHAARGVLVRAWQPWHQLGLGAGDVVWTSSDTGWTRAGSVLLFGAWMHGAIPLMVEAPPEPAERLELLEKYQVNCYGAVSTELRLIMAQGSKRALPHLRWTLSAGEAMTAELAERWQAFAGSPLYVGYGQSETPTATLTDPQDPSQNGMIGKPMEGNRVTIVDDTGNECPPGTEGHLAFGASDPGLMLGYWTEDRPVLELLAGRWHLTGDCGYRGADGNLFFVGREDDIISSSGYRIGPTEVENALMQHAAVAECAVIASPDPVRGEVVKAFVVVRDGYAPDDALAAALQAHVKHLISPYKYPRKLEFIPTLPRTVSGKIQRRALREREFKGANS